MTTKRNYTYDKDVDIAYVSVKKPTKKCRYEYSEERQCVIDIDQDGDIMGVQIFDWAAGRRMPEKPPGKKEGSG